MKKIIWILLFSIIPLCSLRVAWSQDVMPDSLSALRLAYNNKPTVELARRLALALQSDGLWEESIEVLHWGSRKDVQLLPLLWQAQAACYHVEELQSSLVQKNKRLSKEQAEQKAYYNVLSPRIERLLDGAVAVEVLDSLVLPQEQAWTYVQTLFPSLHISKESASFLSYRGDRRLTFAPQGTVIEEESIINKTVVETEMHTLSSTLTEATMPYLSADGVTLFFAAKGEGGLGGYDLYVCRKKGADGYLEPVSLGMPFNSVFNDYLWAVNEEYGISLLVSDRFAPADCLSLYFIKHQETFSPIASLDLETKRMQALLRPIAATRGAHWTPSQTLKRFLAWRQEGVALSQTDAHRGARLETPIEIAPGVLYTSSKQWRSPQGEELFLRYASAVETEKQATLQLESLRQQYHEGDKREKEQLAPEILKLEKQLPLLHQNKLTQLQALRVAEAPYITNL